MKLFYKPEWNLDGAVKTFTEAMGKINLQQSDDTNIELLNKALKDIRYWIKQGGNFSLYENLLDDMAEQSPKLKNTLIKKAHYVPPERVSNLAQNAVGDIRRLKENSPDQITEKHDWLIDIASFAGSLGFPQALRKSVISHAECIIGNTEHRSVADLNKHFFDLFEKDWGVFITQVEEGAIKTFSNNSLRITHVANYVSICINNAEKELKEGTLIQRKDDMDDMSFGRCVSAMVKLLETSGVHEPIHEPFVIKFLEEYPVLFFCADNVLESIIRRDYTHLRRGVGQFINGMPGFLDHWKRQKESAVKFSIELHEVIPELQKKSIDKFFEDHKEIFRAYEALLSKECNFEVSFMPESTSGIKELKEKLQNRMEKLFVNELDYLNLNRVPTKNKAMLELEEDWLTYSKQKEPTGKMPKLTSSDPGKTEEKNKPTGKMQKLKSSWGSDKTEEQQEQTGKPKKKSFPIDISGMTHGKTYNKTLDHRKTPTKPKPKEDTGYVSRESSSASQQEQVQGLSPREDFSPLTLSSPRSGSSSHTSPRIEEEVLSPQPSPRIKEEASSPQPSPRTSGSRQSSPRRLVKSSHPLTNLSLPLYSQPGTSQTSPRILSPQSFDANTKLHPSASELLPRSRRASPSSQRRPSINMPLLPEQPVHDDTSKLLQHTDEGANLGPTIQVTPQKKDTLFTENLVYDKQLHRRVSVTPRKREVDEKPVDEKHLSISPQNRSEDFKRKTSQGSSPSL